MYPQVSSSRHRRDLLTGAAALSAGAMLPPRRASRRQQFPTAKVNTTGLAVTDTEVTVGILHSVTGTMAISETGSVEAEKLAIDQINAQGGVLGRKIKFIQEDGASDWPTFAEKAKKLLVNDKCASVMGCWTSASRKAVLPVFEQYNGMLYYPTFYEGLEQSKNVIYTGQEATQQILAGLELGAPRRRAPRRSTCSAPTTSGRAPPTRSPASTSRTCSSSRCSARNTSRSATRSSTPSSTRSSWQSPT